MPRIQKPKAKPTFKKTEPELFSFMRNASIIRNGVPVQTSRPVLIRTPTCSFYLKGLELQHGGKHDGSLVLVVGDEVKF